MEKKNKIIIAVIAVLLAGGAAYLFMKGGAKKVEIVEKTKKEAQKAAGQNAPELPRGETSPITGIACGNWNRRAVAVMQPSDLQARPAAGFSDADMVFEMPAYTASVTRLMGVYICNLPDAIGAIRSARHDYIPLAKGLDAIFIHWGGSIFALNKLKQNVIDHVDCLSYEGTYCDRWDWKSDPVMRMEDSGHVTGEKVLKAMKDLGFRMENKFTGYPHQADASMENRADNGHLTVGFVQPYDVAYDYDKNSNSYLRLWDGKEDTDRNNGKRIAPKNVVVMFAKSEQIALSTDYAGRGVENPWDGVPQEEKTVGHSIDLRYNDIQIGDPWYDTTDSGEAHYYFNGQEYQGTWKKDKSSLDSKLFFYDENGKEIKFVPGQIWVEVLEPGQTLKWETK